MYKKFIYKKIIINDIKQFDLVRILFRIEFIFQQSLLLSYFKFGRKNKRIKLKKYF